MTKTNAFIFAFTQQRAATVSWFVEEAVVEGQEDGRRRCVPGGPALPAR